MTHVPDRSDLERFRQLVASGLGLQFDDGKLDFLGEVLRARLDAVRSTQVSSYLDQLSGTPGELRVLAQQLTVPETYFFRNADHLRAFVEEVVPERMRARASRRRLRILSAGCASGEEAYTLAMLLRDRVPQLEGWSVELQGIDINLAMIAKARSGRYAPWSLRQTPPEMRERWFRPAGRDHELLESLRALCSFEERNLIQEDPSFWSPGAFDVVFCRNVVMYFAPEVARQVIARIARALEPGGYLFLGHAETLRGVSNDFHLLHTHGTFYYQRRSDKEGTSDVARRRTEPAPPASRAPSSQLSSSPIPSADVSWFDAIHRASERIAQLAERGPQASPAQTEASAARPAGPRERADLTGASALLREERYTEALEALHGLPTQGRDDPDALLLRAVLLVSSGDLNEAKRTCEELLALDELNAGAHYVMALCSEHGGDLRAAAAHDDMASYLDAGFAMPRLHLGLLARRAGDAGTARERFGQALRLLEREDASRILLFGGGFRREALVALCEAQVRASGGAR